MSIASLDRISLFLHKEAPLSLSRSLLADRIPFDTLYIIHRLALSAQYQVVQSSRLATLFYPLSRRFVSPYLRFNYFVWSYLGLESVS